MPAIRLRLRRPSSDLKGFRRIGARRTSHDIVIAYLKRSRATQAIMVNLKSEKGRALFFRLIKRTKASQHTTAVGSTAE